MHHQYRLFCLLVALLATLSLGVERRAWSAGLSFSGLGDLPGGSFRSRASGVSADGSVVVGTGENGLGLSEAFRWTSGGGMVSLGSLLPGRFASVASGVSGDGSVVVGTGQSTSGFAEAFRWTSGGGMVGLGDLPGGSFESYANDISADGGVVVGYGRSASAKPYEAFRWTSGGMVAMGALPGGVLYSIAAGISANGNTIVGVASGSGGTGAFRWTSGGGMVGVGGFWDGAADISADGSVVVGRAFGPMGLQASRWTSSGGMASLGVLPGADPFFGSTANDVSADGSVIVGSSDSTGYITQAFLWNASLGMVNLKSYLIAHGVTGLTGWTLIDATAVSADGRTIVGAGTNPQGNSEAWIATVPEPSSFTLALSGLGVLWWSRTRRRSFAAQGKHGQ